MIVFLKTFSWNESTPPPFFSFFCSISISTTMMNDDLLLLLTTHNYYYYTPVIRQNFIEIQRISVLNITMVMFSWDQIDNSSKDNSTKEYIENFLRNLESEDLVVALTAEFVSSVADEHTRTVGLRLVTFRILFSVLPTRVFSKFVVPSKVLDWLCRTIEDSNAHSPSVRGCAICVIGLIIRNFAEDSTFDYKRIAVALGISIRDAGIDLQLAVSDADCICGPGAILLHQIVNVLAVIADSTIPWLQPIGDFLPAASTVLRRASATTSEPSGRLHVDAAKVYTLVAEVWLEQLASSPATPNTAELLAMIDVPSCVFSMVSVGPVLHDTLLGAYQLSLEVNQKLQQLQQAEENPEGSTVASEDQVQLELNGAAPWTVDGGSALWWVGAIQERVAAVMATLLAAGQTDSATATVAALHIKRIESLLGIVASWFDIHGSNSTKSRVADDKVTAEDATWMRAADRAIDLVECVMLQLKEVIANSSSSQSAALIKSARAAASDVRKGSIALSHSVLTACPLVVCSSQSSHSGETRCLNFALKCLGTPLLFGAIYAAIVSCGCFLLHTSPADDLMTREEAQSVVAKMVRHLSAGLGNAARYTASAAGDIVTAVEDLAASGCVLLLEDPGDLPLATLRALSSVPKGLKTSSSSQQQQQGARGDVSGLDEWRTRCLAALHALFQLALSSHASDPLSRFSQQFTEEVVDVVSDDIASLRLCLGIIVPPTSPSSTSSTSRKAVVASVTERFGSGDAEVLLPVLQTLMACLGQFLDLSIHTVSSASPALSERNHEKLLLLVHDLCSTATRPLLFDDDCVLNCAEIEVLTRIAIVLLRPPVSSSVQASSEQLARDAARALRVGAGQEGEREQAGKTFGTSSSLQHNEALVKESCLACLDMLKSHNVLPQ
jgi:hypothetical protein